MITNKEIKNRFEKTVGGAFQGVDIITDKVTGVQYLVARSANGGGVTPLIDKEGKPLLADIENTNPFD